MATGPGEGQGRKHKAQDQKEQQATCPREGTPFRKGSGQGSDGRFTWRNVTQDGHEDRARAAGAELSERAGHGTPTSTQRTRLVHTEDTARDDDGHTRFFLEKR